MTNNQVIAFVVSVLVCFLFTISGAPLVLDFFQAWAPIVLINTISGFSFLTHFQAISSGVIDLRDLREVEQAVADFAHGPNSGLIVTGSIFATSHRDAIAALAARHKLPAVYPYRYYVNAGGLISYGPDPVDEYRRAAGYVDRVLKGEKPADLPVQVPTNYELVVNLKAAKALGIDIPATVLSRAHDVIE